MATDLIRLMHALFVPARESAGTASWRPPVDVYRTQRGWLVKFELAGVRPEDLRLSVRGNRLALQGARRDWCAEHGFSCYQMEINYSRFERTLEFPVNLESAHIDTEYQYGLLLVRIRTEEDAK